MSLPLPLLPELPPPWRSRVFGQQSPGSADSSLSEDNEGLIDTERLSFIGDAAIHIGITNWLHERYPQHSGQALRAKLMDLVSKKPGEWAKMYKLQSLIIIAPSGGPADPRPHPISKSDLFRAYAGALYLMHDGDNGGAAITNRWIKQIMEFEETGNHDENKNGSDSDASVEDEAIPKSGKNGDEMSGMLNTLKITPSDAPPNPPLKSPEQLPTTPPGSNSRNFLSLLNEKSIQKRKMLYWDETAAGPDHARTWTVKLTVESIEGKVFVGTGHTKKQARSDASEQALKAINWI